MLKETILIQNGKLNKLTNITQNLEDKLNGIQQKMVQYEKKLNQLEEGKDKLRDEMVQKTNLHVSNLTDKNNTLEEKIFLLWSRRK